MNEEGSEHREDPDTAHVSGRTRTRYPSAQTVLRREHDLQSTATGIGQVGNSLLHAAVCLENSAVVLLINTWFCEIRKFSSPTVFTKAFHWNISWFRLFCFTPLHILTYFSNIDFNIIISSTAVFSKYSLTVMVPIKLFIRVSFHVLSTCPSLLLAFGSNYCFLPNKQF